MSNRELFLAIQRWAAENYPGTVGAMRLHVTLNCGSRTIVSIPTAPICRNPADVDESFIPNAVQEAILGALDGKAMRSTGLAQLIGGDTARLYRKPKGGMEELRELGMVRHHKRLGYWRPDAPPPDVDMSEMDAP